MAKKSGYAPVSTQSEEDLGIIQQVIDDDPNCTEIEIKPEHGFGKSDIRRLLDGLKENTHLKVLRMAGLNLDDEDGKRLVAALAVCKVERIHLNYNAFSGRIQKRILEVVTHQGIVKTLEMFGQKANKWTEQEAKEIIGILNNNKPLQHVSLDIPCDDPDAVSAIFRKVPGCQ